MNPHEAHSLIHGRRFFTSIALLILPLSVCGILIISSTAQNEKAEREFKNTIPDHVPIKVKLKNEQSFRKADNKNWARELEVEVRNTGTKPIYYLSVGIRMPEVIINGYPSVFQLRYGRPDLVEFAAPILSNDVPILPGASVTLSISTSQVRGYEKSREKNNLPNPKRAEFYLKVLNFGDGTGLTGYNGAPMPDPSLTPPQVMKLPVEQPPPLQRSKSKLNQRAP